MEEEQEEANRCGLRRKKRRRGSRREGIKVASEGRSREEEVKKEGGGLKARTNRKGR